MRTRLLNAARGLVVPIGLLAMLEIYMRGPGKSSDSLAAPTAAARSLGRALVDGSLLQGTLFTLGSAALGLAIALIAGTLFGIWLGLSRRADAWSFLTIEVLRPIPSVALIPLAMLVFGFGVRMESAVVAFAVFWPILVLAQAAARQVDMRLLEVADALSLSPLARVVKIVLPAMVARLFVAVRLGMAIALVVAVTVEIAANPHGMGYAMIVAQQSLDPALMLAWLFWIAVVGYLINLLALMLERRVARAMGAAT
ncbi:ABC transporter permease [Xenophilus aerolatus]|nr:ABC transporter permease [Xenophilus aerolatus]